MTVKIYGPTASRAARALWIVHELGIPFGHVAMEMKDLKSADYLKVNPNGKVPALVDGDFKLFRSMAINLSHLFAAKHGKDGFFPSSLEDQALVWQWSFWGMTELLPSSGLRLSPWGIFSVGSMPAPFWSRGERQRLVSARIRDQSLNTIKYGTNPAALYLERSVGLQPARLGVTIPSQLKMADTSVEVVDELPRILRR